MADTNNLKVILEAVLNAKSLTAIRKQLAKEKMEVSVDADTEKAEKSISKLEKLGNTLNKHLSEVAKNISNCFSAGVAANLLISNTKKAISELKEMDSLLTKIGTTNNRLSKSDLEKIGDNAFDVASKYGRTATDYLSGVQEASRAGYQNAEGIAELSLAIQSTSDMSEELANSYIIAMDKAYQMNGSVQALTATLDGANNITNRHAISMTELAEGLSAVGTQAASSQVSVDETTAAVATLIAVTQQGGTEMGNAFNGILMNLRQITGAVGDGGDAIDAESLAKYQKACEDLGVSLTTVKDGTVALKEPMQILKELSAEYQKLNTPDSRRVNLLDAIGGGDRADALNALLENYSLYEKMLQDYANGAGSMAREAENAANSWEGSLNRLSNTWTDTVENIADSDAIVTMINGLNGVPSVVNDVTAALGSWGTIGLGAGLFASFKNVGVAQLY